MSDKDESPIDTNTSDIDKIYLQVWEQQQGSVRQRWVVNTFFLTVSFALFGISLQNPNIPVAGNVQRVTALAIYWFSYLVYRQYSDWSAFLRSYLEELENTKATQITLQARWKEYAKGVRKWLTVKRLLIYFGALYTFAVFLLWWAGI